MAAKKIRVYELARELGVENSVIIDLSAELKIGVKSHSSSIDDPSADRVRRLADSKGLRRDPIVEEPTPEKKPAAKKVVSSSSRKTKTEVTPTEKVDAPAKSKVIRSSAQAGITPDGATKDRITEQLKEEAEIAKAVARVTGPQAGAPQARRGPIPPPPPGRRIQAPPPDALGVRKSQPSSSRGGAGPRGTGAGKTSFPTPAQNFPPSSAPGTKGRGSGRTGPGGPGRGPQGGRKKKGKKRRDEADLQPVQTSTLTPKDTAVPEGEIIITRGVTVKDFAPKLNRTTADIVKMMFEAGEMLTATQSLTDEMIELIAEELGATVLIVDQGEEAELELLSLLQEEDEEEQATDPRPPIVTVMGHVDHGKTTLLDTIRKSNIVEGESGGITQHIGAYQTIHNGKALTFIDTPGHEAFSQMRARGAKATDVAVLVVAADDGVMPQTLEALSHAKAAEVPIIVAVTKIDKENADPARIRQMMTEHELVPEEWGGSTMFVDVSPKTGQGMEDLLEAIILVSEVEDLKANPDAVAKARVLEAHLDPGRGPVATVIIETGTLRVGDVVVAGQGWGKVRAMFTDDGTNVKQAPPSMPVAVLGLSSTPLAGDQLRVAPNDRVARTIADARERRRRLANSLRSGSISGGARLEDIFSAVARGEVATLPLVLKADVQGSLEALTDSLKKLDKEHEEVRFSFVHRAVGGITESDVSLAEVSNATIIGFNVRPDRKARDAAEKAGVEVRLYEVIYKVLDDMEAALKGLLAPSFEEVVTGEAEVREIFSVPKLGKIAGCYVQSGTISRGSKVRFLREGVVIWKGSIISLRREKDDVKDVREGYECGVGLENFTDLKSGDVIETYEEKEVAR